MMWTVERVEVRRPERRFGKAVYVLGRWMGPPRDDEATLAVLVGDTWHELLPNAAYEAPASLYLSDEDIGPLIDALTETKPRRPEVEDVLHEALGDTRQTRDKLLDLITQRSRGSIINDPS